MRWRQKIFLCWVLCTAHAHFVHESEGFAISPSQETSSAPSAYTPANLIRSRSIYWPTPHSILEGPAVSPISISSHATHWMPVAAPPKETSSYVSPVHHSDVTAPSLSPVHAPSSSMDNEGTPIPSPYMQGPSPIQSPFPLTENGAARAPSPSIAVPPTKRSIGFPAPPPSGAFTRNPKASLPQPLPVLPPPPPNLDCSVICTEPFINTPPGSPCACVLPIRVGLQVSVALYTFFPLVSELAQEIASGISMKPSQVRIMGANAASGEPEKTFVLIKLVPFGEKFDNTTAFLTYEKFWHKQILIKASFFGDYDVLYVLYPGLPSSPPTAPARIYGNANNPRTVHPLAADVIKPKKDKNAGSLITIVLLSSVTALVLCIGVVLAFLLKHIYYTHPASTTASTSLSPFVKASGTRPAVLGSRSISNPVSFSSSIATHIGSAKAFSFTEIERVTNKFDDSRMIGEGGFGRVYEGTLEDGTQVAIKVLKRDDQQGTREFLAEVEMLSRLHHRNLVKLIGICSEEYIRCLVYELIPNGSVESHLYGPDKEKAPLDWNSRMKIALGAARCLAYLHEDSNPRVIHRDFKSSNILLEYDFTPKVCDFGLARTALGKENEHISTRVMGTFGYVAPEYAMTGHLLVKSDVYSYGVVLLELLTGRKPVDMLRPPGQENLVTWARPMLTRKEDLETIIDSSLGTNFPFDSVAKVAAIASMCVQPEVSQRPFMGEVVQALKLVCNESDEHRGSASCRHEGLSAQYTEMQISSGLSLEAERLLSPPDIFSISARFTRDASGSFRRYSNSGPLSTGRSGQLLLNERDLTSGSISEHGIGIRHSRGLEDCEQWL